MPLKTIKEIDNLWLYVVNGFRSEGFNRDDFQPLAEKIHEAGRLSALAECRWLIDNKLDNYPDECEICLATKDKLYQELKERLK